MAWVWIVSAIFIAYTLRFLINLKTKAKKLPPGPKGLPIIGHFHLLGKNPNQDLSHLAKKHGPIMYMRFGSLPTVVVSSPATAELFLKTKDPIFASRGHQEAGYYVAYQQRDITFGKYTPYLLNMRKLVISELLSNRKIAEYREMRRVELGFLVDSIKKSAEMHETVDLSVKVMALNGDTTCLMVCGKKFDNSVLNKDEIKAIFQEIAEEGGAFNLGDYFPYLRPFDLQGSTRRLKKLSKILDGIIERMIEEHVHSKVKKQTQDFVDIMMGILQSGTAEFEFDRRHVKAVLLDMLVAGMDTPSTVVEWVLSELIRHPKTMKKLQNELEQVVGLDNMVEESHLPKLDYLDCVIKESLRLHPVASMLIRESMEDTVMNGFDIPKGTRLLVNVWALGRDPETWEGAEKFSPERFIGSNIDIRGNDFGLIPFGAGRRICPGIQLGITVVRLIVAQLVHCFDWELPNNNKDLDMSEHFGLVTGRANHLLAIPTYRLHK